MRPGSLVRWSQEGLAQMEPEARAHWQNKCGIVFDENTILWPGNGMTRLAPAVPVALGGAPRTWFEPIGALAEPAEAVKGPVDRVRVYPIVARDGRALKAEVLRRLDPALLPAARYWEDLHDGGVLEVTLLGVPTTGEEIFDALRDLDEYLADHLVYESFASGRCINRGTLGDLRGQCQGEGAAAVREAERLLAIARIEAACKAPPCECAGV